MTIFDFVLLTLAYFSVVVAVGFLCGVFRLDDEGFLILAIWPLSMPLIVLTLIYESAYDLGFWVRASWRARKYLKLKGSDQ